MWDTIRRDGVVGAVCVYTCTPRQAHHALPPVAIFTQARSFECSFFPLSRNACFQLFLRIRFLLPHATMSALPLEPVATAVAEPHVSSVPAVTNASAGSSHRVCDASSGGHYIALVLRIRSSSASVRGRGTCTCEEVRGTCTCSDCVTPAQQFLAAYTVASVMTGVNLDVTGLGNSTVLHHGC